MARIETYTAQRGLQPTATPNISVSNFTNNALQDVGQQVQNVGAMLQQRQEKKDNFAAENAYRRFQLELGQDLSTQAQNIPEGGTGFHDQFLSDVFKPKRDAFLASLPESLRPRFEEVLADETGADFADWSIQAATVERDENYRWAKQEINLTQQQIATAIGMDPELSQYDDYFAAGQALIDSSPLPTPEKALLAQQWQEMAQVAALNTMLKEDPQGVLRELGVDARNLSPTTQFDILSRAVQWQESTDNPNAVSPKGAVGLMQVMPSTARDIAVAIGDDKFPAGENDTVIAAYLSNPFVNKRYGEAYLKQQLQQFAGTRNPIETALVAYNAGPSVAQKWIESGYDDRILSKETRDYKTAVLSSISSPTAKGDPSAVKFVASGSTDAANLDGVSTDLTARVADAFATVGLGTVKVNSAYRDPEHNAEVGGADNSEHTRGNAMDISVAGMTLAERVNLIKALSAAGVTGIGVYANTIHADVGGLRAWGPDHSSNSVPAWAQGVISEHLKGTTPPPVAVAQRFATLPYDRRQQYIASADQAITAQQTAATKASAVQIVETRQAIDNELATIRATGQSTGAVSDTQISTILGEDDYLRFTYQRDVARKTFTAVSDIATMSVADMTARVDDYAPRAGATDFAAQQEVQAAVQREVDRVIKLRANDPGRAAMAFPEVKDSYDALQREMATADPDPSNVQAFVKLMLEKQAEIDVAPDARAPIPNDWAVEIGRALARVPEPAGRNMEDVRYNIQAQYNSLKQYFGEYTDEVIIHSLSEYKGVSTTTAETINAYMKAIQAGGDPFRARGASQAEDMDQVDSLSFWDMANPLTTVNNLLGGQPSATPDAAGMTPEEMLRATTVEE